MISDSDKSFASPWAAHQDRKETVRKKLGLPTTQISGKYLVDKALEDNSQALEKMKKLLAETSDGTD